MGADTLREQQPGSPAHDETTSIDERVDAAVRARRVGSTLARLPRRERDPLLLHVLNDMPYEDISRILGVPIGTVRSRISRGRARLAERLSDGGRT